MADFTVSTDVDALMRSADNAAIKTQLGIPSPEAILNPLVEGQGLLNSFTGSAAAYSLRDLNKTNPDVVEVRRASDETSRVFKANEIGSTLENWVNAEVALPLDLKTLDPVTNQLVEPQQRTACETLALAVRILHQVETQEARPQAHWSHRFAVVQTTRSRASPLRMLRGLR